MILKKKESLVLQHAGREQSGSMSAWQWRENTKSESYDRLHGAAIASYCNPTNN